MTYYFQDERMMTSNTSQPLGLHRLKFHGKGGEYFAIWLVNALLTIVTWVSIPHGRQYVVVAIFTATRNWTAIVSITMRNRCKF